jgi:hypothetical protein
MSMMSLVKIRDGITIRNNQMLELPITTKNIPLQKKKNILKFKNQTNNKSLAHPGFPLTLLYTHITSSTSASVTNALNAGK